MPFILAGAALAQPVPELSPIDAAAFEDVGVATSAPRFDPAALRARVQQSQESFLSLVAAQPRYTYTERYSSWTGYSHTVTVTVDSGAVVESGFQAYGRDGRTEEWVERGETLNTHGRAFPMTMEGHYARCLQTVLSQDPTQHEVYLSFFDNGVLRMCAYRNVHCVDDCTHGTRLGSFSFLP